MKYTMTNEELDIIMPEARKLGIPWYQLVNEILLNYGAKKAEYEERKEQFRKVEKS